MTNVLKHARGMTLIEILFGIGILSFILIGVSYFGRDIFQYNTNVQNSLMAQQDARAALRKFSADLRAAEPSANGSYPLEVAEANQFIFYSDVDQDGVQERARYYLSGTNFLRDIIEPSGVPPVYTAAPSTQTLARNMANGATAIFSYYDASYDGTTAPLTLPASIPVIRLVRATIIVEADPNRAPVPITVTTQVSIRNLKDNL